MWARLVRLAPAGFWLAASPPILPLAGWYLAMPVWVFLGICGVLMRREGDSLRLELGKLKSPNFPLWCIPLWWVVTLLFYALPNGLLAQMVFKTIGTAGSLVCFGAMLTIAFWVAWPAFQGKTHFTLPVWWKVFIPILLAWTVRTYMGTTDRPNAYVGWLPLVILFLAGSWFRIHPLVHAAAFLNFFMGALLVEWYTTPLNGQVARVKNQPGVALIRHDPNLDFRWLREGCKPGRWWMGTRSMTGLGQDPTTVQLNNKGFKYGGSTADQGIVDCNMHLVMVGDFDDGGRLYVLDETNGKKLSESKVNFSVQSGFTGIDWLPGHAWLVGSYEANKMFVLLKLRHPEKPEQLNLPYHATHVVFCQALKNPCFYSAVQQGDVRKHYGPNFSKVLIQKRKGRSLAPDMLLVEERKRLYVSDVLTGIMEVFDSRTLKPLGWYKLPSGIRFMVTWPANGKIWGANFMDGYLYEVDHDGSWRRLIFLGQKSRWLNLSRDGKSLLWCAASACYSYRP